MCMCVCNDFKLCKYMAARRAGGRGGRGPGHRQGSEKDCRGPRRPGCHSACGVGGKHVACTYIFSTGERGGRGPGPWPPPESGERIAAEARAVARAE